MVIHLGPWAWLIAIVRKIMCVGVCVKCDWFGTEMSNSFS